MNKAQKFMRIAYAAIIMIMISASSAFAANWEFVTGSDNCDISVDANSLVRKGNLVQCWVMFDYRKARYLPDRKEFYSSEFLYEIDSIKREIKILSSYSFADNGGAGVIVCSGNEDLWPPVKIPTGSAAEMIMNYAFKTSQNRTK
jgi:hypothetical protein